MTIYRWDHTDLDTTLRALAQRVDTSSSEHWHAAAAACGAGWRCRPCGVWNTAPAEPCFACGAFRASAG